MIKNNFFKKAAFMKNKTLFLSMMIVLVAAGVWFVLAAGLTAVTIYHPITNENISGNYTFSALTDATADNVTFYYCNATDCYTIGVNDTQGTAFNYTYDTNSILSDGTYDINATAINNTGDSVSAATPITTVTFDNTAPTVSNITSPANDTWVTSMTISINGSDVIDSALDINIYVNDTSNVTATNNLTEAGTDVTLTGLLDNSTYLLYLVVTDDSGNVKNSSEFILKYDTAAPSAIRVSPTDFTNNATPTATVNVTDLGAGVNDTTIVMNYSIRGGTFNSLTESSTGITDGFQTSATLPDLSPSDGDVYNISVEATDNATNAMTIYYWSFKYDGTAPTVNPTTPATDTWTTDNTTNFVFNYTDDLSSTASCTLYVEGTAYGINATTANYTSTTITYNTTVGMSDGDHTWYVNCTDLAGNIGQSSERTVRVDNTTPSDVSLTTPATDTWTIDLTPNFVFNYTDALSSNASCELKVGGTGFGINATTANYTSTTITANASIAEGIHQWNITCTDLATNSKVSSTRTINIDKTAPTVYPTTPATDTWTTDNTTDFVFNYTDDVSSNASCTLYVEGTAYGINATTANYTSTTITYNTTAGMSDGDHTWYVNCTDLAGNIGQSSERTVRVDNTTPSDVSLTTPADNDWTTDQTQDFVFNYSDDLSSTASCELKVGGTGFGINATTANYTSTTITANASIGNGIHQWNITCTDLATNSKVSNTRTIKVDNTAPSAVSLTTPADDTWTTSQQPDFVFNYSDLLSSTASCELKVGGTGFGINATTANYTSTTITANASIDEGTHQWNITCIDLATNSKVSNTRTIKIDKTTPSAIRVSPIDLTNDATPTVTVNVTDLGAGVNDTTIVMKYSFKGGAFNSLTESSTGITNGFQTTATLPDASPSEGDVYNISVEAKDNATNTMTTYYWSFKYDGTEPTVSLTTPATDTWTTDLTPNFVFNYSDLLSSTASCELKVDGTGYGINATTANYTSTTITANATIAEGTTHQWNITCTDLAGNSKVSSTRTIKIDETAPSAVSLTTPADDTWTTSQQPDFVFNYSDLLSSTASCELKVGGTGYGINATTANYTSTTITANATINDGTHQWNITCTDLATNSKVSSTRTIKIDSTAPTVNPTTPANNAWTTDNTTDFVFNYTDDLSSTASCTLYVGGTAYGINATTANYTSTTITYNTTAGMSDGDHTWYVNCTDLAGKIGQSSERTVKVDDTAPSDVSLTTPATDTWTTSQQPDFVFNYSDALSSNASCELKVGGTGYGINATTANYTSTTITANATIAEGTRQWNITCTDLAGNSNVSDTRTIKIDSTEPAVSLTTPADDSWTTSQTPDFVFNYSDDLSSNASCELKVGGTGYGINATTANYTSTTITANATIAEGTHQWNITCTDLATNSKVSSTRTINIDATAPTVSLTSPTGGYWTNDNTTDFTFTATDNVDTSFSCILYVGNAHKGSNSSVVSGTSTTITINSTSALSEGDHAWTVNCTDGSGNEGTATERTVKIDVTAPVFDISQPTTNQEVNSSALTILSSVATDGTGSQFTGVTSCAVSYVDSVPNSKDLNPGTINFNGTHCTGTTTIPSTAAEGNGTLTVALLDAAGNQGSATKYIDYTDTSSTVINIYSPSTGTTTDNTPLLNISTGQAATCKYSTSTSDYSVMTDVFDVTSGTSHLHNLSTLTDERYTYHISCYTTAASTLKIDAPFTVNTRTLYNITRPDVDYNYWLANQWHNFRLLKTTLQNTTLTNYNVTTVLTSVESNYNFVYYYVNDVVNTSYVPGRPTNDLTTFNVTTGGLYYIYTNTTDRLEIN